MLAPAGVQLSVTAATQAVDLAVALRAYGFVGLDPDGAASVPEAFRVEGLGSQPSPTGVTLLQVGREDEASAGIVARPESAGTLVFDRKRSWFRRPSPVYRTVRPSVSLSGRSLEPVWWTDEGRCVLAWDRTSKAPRLICGLQIAEELVRYAQGDPAKVYTARDKTLWGFGHERATYLFEDHLVAGQELVPWADVLGTTLSRLLSDAAGLPRVAPLPDGAVGAVLLTGDDDQAELAKYDEQLALLDGFPISYFMLPWTKQSPERLAPMPAGVEFGVHVDALEDPSAYRERCLVQSADVAALLGRRPSAVRNHGHLNHGYWEERRAWREAGIRFDLNVRALDGTCPTGSYMPHRFRAEPGSWTDHWTLFSTFSDSMLYLQKWPQRKQIRCIEQVAGIIEERGPGIIVVNMHPQNVSDHHDVHRAIMAIGRRPGWTALGVESFLSWLDLRDSLLLRREGDGFVLTSSTPAEHVAVHIAGQGAARALPKWSGAIRV